MRQRRQRLQVSTFPFLAVLLCAMGSLILLLLVIDRRAKIVARVKAMRAMEQAWSQATAQDERAAAAHRAEWERRRRLLHEQLMQEDQQVRSELQGVQSKVGAAAGEVEAELASSRQLQEQLQAERSRLARFANELSVRRAEAAKKAQEANLSRADLERLTVDLERMERTLTELKALRQRQQQTYSLVPYRGKRGDNRRPLYLECTEDDLIFHPDHLALHSWALTPRGIRAEIERRLERQRADVKRVGGKPQENGYLLMLIRPNGIGTYYQALAALRGLPIDFGYEFIDQDWILDFSENENTPKRQPWMAAEQTRERQPSGSSANTRPTLGIRTGRSSSATGGSGWWESAPNAKNREGQPGVYAPLAGTSGWAGRSMTASTSPGSGLGGTGDGSGPGGPGPDTAAPKAGAPAWRGLQATPQRGETALLPGPGGTQQASGGIREANATPLRDGPNGAAGYGDGPPNRQGGPPGLSSAGTGLGRPVGLRAMGYGPLNNSSAATKEGTDAPFGMVSAENSKNNPGTTVSPGAKDPSPSPAASPGIDLGTARGTAPALTEPPYLASGMPQAETSGPAGANGQRSAIDQNGAGQAAQNGGLGGLQNDGSSGNADRPGMNAGSSPLASVAPTGGNGSGSPGDGASSAPAATRDAGGGGPPHGKSDSGEPLRGPPGNPLDRFAAQNAQRKPARTISPRPGPLIGNRDWIISIECTAETLVIPSAGQHIAITEVSSGGNNRLLETVQRMIARRQATVRPGEPPYRPMIRFRVRPDGVRSYYLAYPALEALHLPTSRENLDPEENKAAGRQR